MPTWLFFIGITVFTMVICVVVTIVYLGKDPKAEDDLDRRLTELSEQNAERRAKRDAANKAKAAEAAK